MIATYVEARKTLVTPQDAVSAFRTACNQHWHTTKPDTVATLMAQSALETGRWASMYNFNVSNVKCEPTRRGFYTLLPILNEIETRNGKRVTVWYSDVAELAHRGGAPIGKTWEKPPGHPQARFRAFETLTSGVIDKLYFLNRPRYVHAKEAALGGSPGAYSRALAVAGYYTADVEPYTRALVSLYSTFLPLCRAETQEPVPLPPKEEDRLCKDMAECMRVELPDWLLAKVQSLHEAHIQDIWTELRDRS